MHHLFVCVRPHQVGAFFYGEAQCTDCRPVEAREGHEGETCDDCGRSYSEVYAIPDEVWAQIHERAPAGLLCPTCCLKRVLSLLSERARRIEGLENDMDRRVNAAVTAVTMATSALSCKITELQKQRAASQERHATLLRAYSDLAIRLARYETTEA